MCTDDAPFYPACIINPKSNVWYKRQAMGPSTLGSIMKNMASEAKIPNKKITNHSGRKTSISTLKHSNFDPLNIAQLSGHWNLKSLDDYSSASDEQQKAVSFAISNRLHGKHKVQQFTEAPPPPPVLHLHAPSLLVLLFSKISQINLLYPAPSPLRNVRPLICLLCLKILFSITVFSILARAATVVLGMLTKLERVLCLENVVM